MINVNFVYKGIELGFVEVPKKFRAGSRTYPQLKTCAYGEDGEVYLTEFVCTDFDEYHLTYQIIDANGGVYEFNTDTSKICGYAKSTNEDSLTLDISVMFR